MSTNGSTDVDEESDEVNVQSYRLSGDNHNQNGEVYRKGDIVALTDEQYENFQFKFEPIEGDVSAEDVAAPAAGTRAFESAKQRVAADESRVVNSQMQDRDSQHFVADAGAQDVKAESDESAEPPQSDADSDSGSSGDSPFDPTDLTVDEVESRLDENDYSDSQLDAIQSAEAAGDDRNGVRDAIDEKR